MGLAATLLSSRAGEASGPALSNSPSGAAAGLMPVVVVFRGSAFREPSGLASEDSRIIHVQDKAETPVLWPPHVKSGLIGKDSDAGREIGRASCRERV